MNPLVLFNENLSDFCKSSHYTLLKLSHSPPISIPFYWLALLFKLLFFVSLLAFNKYFLKYRELITVLFMYYWHRQRLLLQYFFFIFSILLSFTVHQKQIKSPCSCQDLWLNHYFIRFLMVSITSMQIGCFTEIW